MNIVRSPIFFPDRAITWFIICLQLLVFSCEKEPEPLTKNSLIRGYAYIVQENTDLAGTKAVASGPYGSFASITDSMGEYRISNVPNGTYVMEFTRKGFGTIKKYGVQVFGYDTVNPNSVMLFALPQSNAIPELDLAYFSESWLVLEAPSDECNGGYYEMRFFIGPTENVSWENYTITVESVSAYDCRFYLPVSASEFEGGEVIYVTGYSCSHHDYGYTDLYTGIRVFSTLDKEKKSAVFRVTVP